MFKEHEKFWAFMFLGAAILILALTAAYIIPKYGESETVKQLFVGAMGAFTLALGSAANALFRIRDPDERKVEIDQPASNPVPVDDAQNHN